MSLDPHIDSISGSASIHGYMLRRYNIYRHYSRDQYQSRELCRSVMNPEDNVRTSFHCWSQV